MAIARAEHGRPIEQRFSFDLPPIPEHIESLGEIRLRKAGIEFERYIERRQRLVILVGHTQHPPERAMAKTIEVIERHGIASLAQRRFQSRNPILRLVNKGTLQIDVAERAMA